MEICYIEKVKWEDFSIASIHILNSINNGRVMGVKIDCDNVKNFFIEESTEILIRFL